MCVSKILTGCGLCIPAPSQVRQVFCRKTPPKKPDSDDRIFFETVPASDYALKEPRGHMLVSSQSQLAVFQDMRDVIGKEALGADFQEREGLLHPVNS